MQEKMRISTTLITYKGKSVSYKGVKEERIAQILREGELAVAVEALREGQSRRVMSEQDSEDEALARLYHIPAVCFSGHWQNRNGRLQLKHFSGLVLLEVSNLPSAEEARQVRDRAANIPYTRLAYVGARGRSVVIVASTTWADGQEPQDVSACQTYYAQAQKMMHYHYSSQLMLCADICRPDIQRMCLLSHDEEARYNPRSLAYQVEMDVAQVPEYQGREQDAEMSISDQDVVSMHSVFEWCYRDAMERAREQYGMDVEKVRRCAVSLLADNCCESNLPQDFAVDHARWKASLKMEDHYLEEVFANAYEVRSAKHIPYGKVDKNALLAYKVEAFLKQHYELRRNVLTGVVQYRRKNGFDFDFHDITEMAMNTMTNRAVKAGIGSWDKDMRRIVNSEDVPLYDPLADFIYGLPEWDGKDRVGEFVSRIPTDCPQVELYIRIWLRSMVAHWLGRDNTHGNALVPLLIGGQGCGKTSFCGIVLPPELRDYYNDKVNFKNETDLSLGLSSFALINIDEFDSLSRSQQPVLKYLLSKHDVKFRQPYGKAYVSRRRYASFVATTNHSHPLMDVTGSRRFACIPILAGRRVDFLTPMCYEQFYAQLAHEVFHGARYWLDERETEELMRYNRQFTRVRDVLQMVKACLTPGTNEVDGTWMSQIEILDMLTARYPELEVSKGTRIDLGRALTQLRFPKHRMAEGYVYLVK